MDVEGLDVVGGPIGDEEAVDERLQAGRLVDDDLGALPVGRIRQVRVEELRRPSDPTQ